MQEAPYNAHVSLAPLPVFLRRLIRISLLMLHLVWGVALAALVFPLLTPGQRDRIIMAWARGLLSVLGVRAASHDAARCCQAARCWCAITCRGWISI